MRLDPQHPPAWAVLGYLNLIDIVLHITGELSRNQLDEALAQVAFLSSLGGVAELRERRLCAAAALGFASDD